MRRNPDIDPSIGLLVIIVVLVGVIVAARAAYSLNILKGMNRKESTWFAILATFICFPLWLVILSTRPDSYIYSGEEHSGERPEDQMNVPGIEPVSYLTIVTELPPEVSQQFVAWCKQLDYYFGRTGYSMRAADVDAASLWHGFVNSMEPEEFWEQSRNLKGRIPTIEELKVMKPIEKPSDNE